MFCLLDIPKAKYQKNSFWLNNLALLRVFSDRFLFYQ